MAETVQIRRYGKTYDAEVIRSTDTRYLVTWTYGNGAARTLWVHKSEVGDPEPEFKSPVLCKCGSCVLVDGFGSKTGQTCRRCGDSL